MAGTHGDLFREIGTLVVAAHDGAPIDLRDKAGELAERYANLRVPADAIARAIARSAGAVGISLAMVQFAKENRASGMNGARGTDLSASASRVNGSKALDVDPQNDNAMGEANGAVKSPAVVLPSGVRLAVLS